MLVRLALREISSLTTLATELSHPHLHRSRQLSLLGWEMLLTTINAFQPPTVARGTPASLLPTILLINMSEGTTALGIWLKGLTIPSQSFILI